MSLTDLLTRCADAGIRFQVEGSLDLVADTPVGALTADLRELLRLHKPTLARLVAMRKNGCRSDGHPDQPPWPLARWPHDGGPGICCSCGDGLSHPQSLGRCDDCQRAAELFYQEMPVATTVKESVENP